MPGSPFTTNAIGFDTSGLIPRKDEQARKLWLNAYNDVIEFRAFDLPPDIPVRLRDAKALRDFYEDGAKRASGELLLVTVRDVQRVPSVWLELRLPAQPRGSTFVVSLTLPFRDGSFVIKAQGIEVFEDVDLNDPPPEHALSRARATLSQIESSLQLDATLAGLEPFERRSWWEKLKGKR